MSHKWSHFVTINGPILTSRASIYEQPRRLFRCVSHVEVENYCKKNLKRSLLTLGTQVETLSKPLLAMPDAKDCKSKKKVDITTAQSVLVLREVLAHNAHVAPHGSKHKSFQAAADALKTNGEFQVHLDGKSVTDRYERL